MAQTQQELRASTLHQSLQMLVSILRERATKDEVTEAYPNIEPYIVSGHRTKGQQNDCFTRKLSMVSFPFSPHNMFPSLAVDLQAINTETGKLLDGDDAVLWCCRFAVMLFKIATERGIPIRWGGLWMNNNTKSLTALELFNRIVTMNTLRRQGHKHTKDGQTTFVDAPHFELPNLWDVIKSDTKKLESNSRVPKKGR